MMFHAYMNSIRYYLQQPCESQQATPETKNTMWGIPYFYGTRHINSQALTLPAE